MRIAREEALRLLVYDNPWWAGRRHGPGAAPDTPAARALARRLGEPGGPVLVAGPCRSGKTGALLGAVRGRLDAGDDPRSIVYICAADPVFAALGPLDLLDLCAQGLGLAPDAEMTVLLDDAHRLPDWERTLAAIGGLPGVARVAAAASVVPGGRGGLAPGADAFRTVAAPHPTFADWLRGRALEDRLLGHRTEAGGPVLFVRDMDGLNREFLGYANYGAPASLGCVLGGNGGNGRPTHRQLREAFDAVFRTDLPGLYGVGDSRLLVRVFSAVAWRTGMTTTFAELGRDCECTAAAARRCLDYLEDAFLASRVLRVDERGSEMRGAPFKVYVAAPWMRAALFGAVEGAGEAVGRVAETALFAQWHAAGYGPSLRYARNREGGVDLVGLAASTGRPGWACAVRYAEGAGPDAAGGLDGLAVFARRAGVGGAVSAATLDAMGASLVRGVSVSAVPCALLSYAVARGLEG